MTTLPEVYSHDDAWLKIVVELQRKGLVTRVWRDASGWRVGYWTHSDWEMMEENKE